MGKAQYAILRFAKYKGPEIGRIEAHDERTKETYASNPDVDTSRSRLNFHLVKPQRSYRAEAERQIAEAGCRTRKDSVRVVETLITASPEFFQGKNPKEVKAFFTLALDFIKSKQSSKTIISAVVHMDEKTPHMHLSFVPITPDGRLSAKDILGNRKNLTKWQDDFWKFMVKKYPDLERGESASETGRTHIPPRLFKEATHLNQQRDALMALLTDINPLNARKRAAEMEALLDKYISGVERMRTQMKKYNAAYKELKAEVASLEKEVDASKESVLKRLETGQKLRELEELQKVVDNIPKEILDAYKHPQNLRKEKRNCL
ncbi:MAG: MobV family relaxase [Eubacteriales bacterium]|nr:MobV family relaxase [Eubacteriales bacterium]